MKKINSNAFGGIVIGIGLILLCIIPSVLYTVNLLVGSTVIETLMLISLGLGAAVEICMGCILIIELRQDKIIDRHYTENPASTKTPQQILDTRKKRGKR